MSSQGPRDNLFYKESVRWRLSSLSLFLLVLLLGALTLADYGMTWDEDFRFSGGDSKLAYYSDLFSGERPAPMSDKYPGLFDLPLALAHELFPEWGTRSQKGHIWSFCFGLLGLLAAWRTTARLGGERAGFWALLLLICLPRYYGHMFFNPKDIPLAGTYMLGVWVLVALFQKMPTVSFRCVAWFGFVAGLAMSTRIAGFLLLVYFGCLVGVHLFLKFLCNPVRGEWVFKSRDLIFDLIDWGFKGAMSGLVALLPLLIFWPALHSNPFAQAEATVESIQSFGWAGWVLMEGHFHEAANLPFYYVPYWLLRTIPELHLGLLLVSLCVGLVVLRRWRSEGQSIPVGWWMPLLVLPVSGIFPLAYIYFTQPSLYDGTRHFLFALPPLVCVAALGLEFSFRRLLPRFRLMVQSLVAGLIGIIAFEMASLHPYQYIYFNTISGGLKGAYMRDDTDYWGASHKEAAEWLNTYIEEMDPDEAKVYRVHQRYSLWMLQEHLDKERFIMSKEREGADFFVSTTRFNLHASYPEAELLYAVERHGVPLCFVFSLSGDAILVPTTSDDDMKRSL